MQHRHNLCGSAVVGTGFLPPISSTNKQVQSTAWAVYPLEIKAEEKKVIFFLPGIFVFLNNNS